MTTSRRRILLTGVTGQVGGELRAALGALGDLIPADRQAVDLTDEPALRFFVRNVSPDLIVNAAAYTAVDRAESEAALAFRVNADAPRVLAEEAARAGIRLVHFSTDYVFDGTAHHPYRETDAPAPLGVYGESKLAGDRGVLASGAAAWIFRVAWVYGRTGKNFFRTMERLAGEDRPVGVVADQIGTPTWAREIAVAVTRALESALDLPAKEIPASGVYHLASPDTASWHTFAEAIMAGLNAETPRPVQAITTAEFRTPTRRPAWSVLDATLARDVFGVALRPWREQLADCFRSAPVVGA